MPTLGDKNQPLVATTDTFNPPADINSSTNWSATFANVRTVANTTALNALTGADRWAGLTVYKLDSNEFYTYSGSAWLLNAIGQKPRIDLTRTTTQSNANNTQVVQTGWTVTANRGGFTEIAGVITIPRTGFYNIYGQASWATNATGTRVLSIEVGGTAVYRNSAPASSALAPSVQVSASAVPLTQGNQVRLAAWQNSGGATNTTGSPIPMKFIIEWAGE
jgi:hypothetical protein